MENQLNNKNIKQDATHKQIRGSSLLLLGRGFSVILNFATQVLIVRYLSKGDYGAWTYCLALVAFFQAFATIGLDRSITRFIPIYHEKEEFDKLFGTLFLVLICVVVAAIIIVGAVYVSHDTFSRLIANNEQAPMNLLFVMIFLVPVQAFDGILLGLFASFAKPRAIFYRKHILAPTLKLTVALLLIKFESDVLFLAYGFLFASLVGVIICFAFLLRLLKQEGLFARLQLANVNVPAREIFAFTIPLLSSDILSVLMHSTDTLILGYFHGTSAVASYQVILPAAHVNTIVMASFGLLYTPLAARLFAQRDYAAINDLYWRTATWLGILSFPMFAVTFCLAQPLTALLYGARYEESARFLQMLAFAYYFNVVLGCNGLTLKVLGKIRYVVTINIIALIANVVLNLILIPRYGALGAAISTALSMVVHNILKQLGLKLATGVTIFDRKYLPFYSVIVLATITLLVIEEVVTDSMYFLLPLAALLSILVIKLCQKELRLEETFPEITKVPLMRKLFNANSG